MTNINQLLRRVMLTVALFGAFILNSKAQISFPYTETFAGITANNTFPAVTGGAWSKSGTNALQPTYSANQASYNRSGNGDTKFISFRYSSSGNVFAVGPFSLTAGKTYQLSVLYKADGLTGFGPLQLTWGTTNAKTAQTNVVASVPADIVNAAYQTLSGTFVAATTGNVYFAIKSTDNGNPWYLSLDNFSAVELPATPATPTQAAGIPSCATGAQLNFTGSAPSGETWYWQTSATGTSTANSASPNYVFFNGTYYLRSYSSTTGLWSATSSSVTVSNLPTPPTAPTISGTLTVNPNQTTTLTANGAGGTYNWYTASSGGTLVSTGASFTTPGTCTPLTYYVDETDVNSCVSTRTPVSVAVNTTVSATPANALICSAGGSVTLTAPAGASSYAWTGAGLNTNSGQTVIASPTVTTAYSVVIDGVCTLNKNVGVITGVAPAPTATPSTICFGNTAQLNSGLSAGTFGVASIPFAPATTPGTGVTVLANAGSAVTPLSGGSTDDGGWGGIPIGFSYNFFGSSFTTLGVGTNGLVMFGTIPGYGTSAGQLGQFTFATPAFPNTGNPGNVIGLMLQDMNFGTAGSSLRYWTEGIAPTRRFVLSGVYAAYTGGGLSTVQLMLYETTGVVEIHITSSASTGGRTIGLQDATKTIGALAPGWNNRTTTLTTPEAWRFIPPANYSYSWTPSANLSNPTIANPIYNPSASLHGLSQTFNVMATDPTSGCSNSSTVSVVVKDVPTAPVITSANPMSACGGQTATLTVSYTGTDTVRWFTTATGGTPIARGLSYTTPVLTNGSTNTYYVETYNGTCNNGLRQAIVVNAASAPVIASVTASPANLCLNGSTLLRVNATAGSSPITSYTWSPSTYLYSTNQDTVNAFNVGAQTTYTVSVFDGLCSSTGTVTINAGNATAAPTATPPAPSSYAASAASFTGDEEILGFSFGTLNVTSTCSTLAPGPGSVTASYSNYTSGAGAPATPTITAGTATAWTATIGTCNGFYGTATSIFIDFNQDGDFADAGEQVVTDILDPFSSTGTVLSGSITIPTTAYNGTTRLRVVHTEGTSAVATGSYFYGETEDYLINITGATPYVPCPNVAWSLNANASLGSGSYTYAWTPTTGLSNPNIANPTAIPTATTTYTVLVTDATCGTFSTNTVTLTTQVVPITITPSATNVCGANPITLTAGGGTSYTWSPNVGLSATTGTSVTAIAANGYSSVAVQGFNADVVANGIGAPSTSATADVDGGGYYFNDATFQLTGASALPSAYLPSSGVVNSANTPTLSYQLKAYASNNSLRLNNSTTGKLSLNTPTSASEVYLLATSGSGAATADITVHFTDGTSQLFSGNNIADWYGGSNFAIQGFGRCSAAGFDAAGGNSNPRLYDVQLVLNGANTSKLIDSIYVTRTSTSGVLNVMAVSVRNNTPPSSITYTVTGTLGNCTNTANATINYTAPPTINVTNSVPVFCGTGGTSNLSVSSSNDPNYTYSWTSANPSILSATSGSSTTATVAQSGVVTLTATDNTAGTYAGCVNTQNISISVYPFPAVNPSVTTPILCPGVTTTINSNVSSSNFSVTCIPIATEVAPASGVTDLATGGVIVTPQASAFPSLDDGGWGAIPIGFAFNYFGTNFTSLNASTNGTVNFGPFSSFNASQFSFSGFPSTGSPANTIAVIAQDMYLANSGTIRYWTTGTAPNRKFVLEYLAVPGYSTAPTQTAQLMLYETTGIVEVHVTAANDGTHSRYIGLQNGAQTIGATAKNCTSGAANYYNGVTDLISNLAWRFDPPHSYTFAWTPTAEISGSATGSSITAAPSSTGTTTYSLNVTDLVTGCSNATPITSIVDVRPTPVTPATINVTSTLPGSNPYCGPHPVDLTVATSLGSYDTVRWYTAATGGTLVGRGTVLSLPLVSATTTYYAETYNGACTNNGGRVATTITITAPPSLAINTTPSNSAICHNDTATLVVSSTNTNYAYTWNPGNLTGASIAVNPTNPGIVATTQTYTVTASDNISGCANTASKVVTINPLPASLSVSPTSPMNTLKGTPLLVTASGGGSAATSGPGGTYCQPTSSCSFDIISNVTLNGINRNSNCDGGGYKFVNNPNQTTNLVAGSTYNYSITTDSDTEGASMWIDWNGDGTFQASEFIFSNYYGTVPAVYTGSFTVPSNVSNGTTRMRVRCSYATSLLATDACTNLSWGETEDYLITLTNIVSNPFTWSSTNHLYLNANATTPYTGTASSQVYAMPPYVANSPYNYTVTATNTVTGCKNSTTFAVNVDTFPSNYNCANASLLTITPTCNLVSGTSKHGEYNPAAIPTTPASPTTATCGNADDDVWYTFTRPAGMTAVSVRVVGSSNYDVAFEILTGACGGPQTVVACVNNTSGTSNSTENYQILVPSGAPTNNYYVRVYDARTGYGSGDFDICVYGIVPPPINNDPCGASNFSSNMASWGGASTILSSFDGGSPIFMGQSNNSTANPPTGVNLVYFSGSTAYANNLGVNEPTPPCGNLGSNAKTVWFKFKAPTIGGVDVTL
ncbi:MAG: GEVED domain-containing protein, partial [Chitinophagales bacterium]|nr:GEVED domain-containing protein [Chitinophagales bacterium]